MLNVRLDRPVEGCQIYPHAYLYQKGEKGQQRDKERFVYRYRWLRGPERPVCANATCPRAQSFSPIQWSKFARKGCSFLIQCVVCAKLRLPRHHSVFCTLQCFQDAWKAHKRVHQMGRGRGAGSGADDVSSVTTDPLQDGEDETPPPPPLDYLTADTSEDDWQEVSTERSYCPQMTDIGRCLKLEIRVLNPDGSLFFGPRLTETEPVLSAPPPPPQRPLLQVKNVAAAAGGLKFRIATYNVLAEIYATQTMYPYCDHWALNWNYRKINLLREMREVAADVLFLQEVQADHYEQHILPELSEEGYDGLYKHKTRESMGASGKVDGCAILWRRGKFRLAEKYLMEFNDCARRQASELGLSHDQQQTFLQRVLKDNVAQAVVLEVLGRPRGGRHGGNMVCMANTHLYSHPEFPDVKLWQCHQLLQWLEGLTLPSNMPLVLCGDFNSEPSSAVYELVSHQAVGGDHPDLQLSQSSSSAGEATELLRNVLLAEHHHQVAHNLLLKSAYATLLGDEPRFTNYTVGYVGVLDYIWFSGMHWRPLSVAPIPDEQELASTGEALPNALYPSDHLMLFSDLQFGAGPGPGGGGGGGGGLGGLGMGELRKPAQGLGMGLGGFGTPTKNPGASPLLTRKDSRGTIR